MNVVKLNTNNPDVVIRLLEKHENESMVLVRGLPGHNRNDFAREVALSFDGSQCFGFDDIFTVDPAAKKRVYRFYPDRVKDAHALVRAKAEQCVKLKCDTIIIANPFLDRRNLTQFFIPLAEKHGYDVIVVTLSAETNPQVLAALDEHGINGPPVDAIARMVENWEQDPDLSEYE
jgi:hypothetical protein